MIKDQRDKILYKNTILNYGWKTVYYIFSFLAVPLVLNFLGKERFGIFQTILTFISWAMLANLGIGNGLRNKISEYIGSNKSNELKGIIGSAFSASLSISIILLLTGLIFFGFIFDPLWLFSNVTISSNEIRLTFLISFVFFCFNLFFSLFSSIAYGIHKSYIVTIAQVFQYGLYCLFLFFLIKAGAISSLIFVSIVYGVSMILSQLIPIFIISKKSELWPPDFKKRKNYYKELLSMSIGFFVLQLSSIVLFSSDNFILSKLLGPDDVAEYSIANKIFFLIINVFSIILIQVWNSTTDAMARKDYEWIKRTVKRLNKILILVFIGSIFIALILNPLIKLWVGQSFNFSLTFRLSFAIYVLIHCINAIYVNILNGLGKLTLQTISYIITAILNFIISYLLIIKMNIGVSGVLYSKIICVVITTIICIYDYKRFFKSIENI